MISRLVILVAVVIAAGAIIFAFGRFVSSSGRAATPASLPTDTASYLGVYEAGALGTYQPVADFTSAAGRPPNLVGYYSGWREPFQASFAQAVNRHGAATLLQWDPTLASVPRIAAGGYDGYLRSYADSVRDFGQPVVIGFGHEMNAPWYTWGYGNLPPPTFVTAWRHIVTLFRGQRADNVTWLWTLQADEPGTGPVASWWPGSQYVKWIGIDGYHYRSSDNFDTVFGKTIDQVRAFTSQPVLLSETAVSPAADPFATIPDLFRGMAAYKTLGLVWFDKNKPGTGIDDQDWRIEDNLPAEIVFRLGVRNDLTPSPPGG
jgi:hypothetical protein